MYSALASARRPASQGELVLDELDYPGAPSPALIVPTPVRVPATPGEVRRREPESGEHTAETLADHGDTPQEVGRMRAGRVA